MSDLFSDLDDEFSLSVAPKKSGLGSLFGSSPKTERVSPKPSPQASPVLPKRKAEPEKPAPAAAPAQPNRPTVVYAIPGVICHKYNTSKSDYDLIGKIGVAILGLPQLNSFQMLLYRGNNDHVAQIPLHPEFHFAIQNELFASFADSQRQNWSIKFPSVEIISLFSMHLAIVKATMGKKEDSVTTQDIVVGSGNPINTEDQIKLTYSAHIVQSDCTVGKLFDSNLASDKPLRMTVGNHGKTVRGLHQGVKGMVPGGKRIIVIPSSLGYGATGLSGRVPPNSTIVYQVELVAVKNQDEPEPEAKQESVVISDVDDNEGKNPVMDRVKKFGVSMTGAVPNFDKPKEAAQAQAQPTASAPAANASAQPAAKEEQRAAPAQEQSHTQAQVQAQAQAQPAASAPASSADQQLALLQSQIQMLMQMQMQQAAAAAAPPAATEAVKQKEEPAAVKTEKKEEIVEEEEDVDTVPYSNADNMKFLHDTRMIHEEIKASVVSAATKIETLQRDIKNSIFGRDDEVSKEKMSGTVLIQTITQYVEQNEQLQQEVIKKGERIDELREKTARILEKNKLLIEEHTNTMEERNNALTENTEQSRKLINALRDEKLDIEEKLHSSTEELSAIRSNLSKLNHTNANLSEHLSTMKGEILRLKTEASSIQATKLNEDSELNELRSSLRDEQAERKRLEEQLEKLEEELNDAKTTLTKFREGMEERKQKWIQIKSQMDKAHEDEKLAAMKQMKAQLLKLKKEKDEAVEEAENIEHNIERRWRENIGRLKIQFKERVDELQQDFSDDKERELNAAITEAQDLAKRQLKETKQSIVEQYKAGFKASRYEQLSAESSSKIQEREKQLEAAFKARKEYMASMIKKIMGGMFYSIREDIEQEEEYQGGDILVTLVDAIRQATMDGMQNVKTYFEEHSSTASMIENEVAGVVVEDEIVEDELIEDVSPEVSEGVISDDELIEDAAPEDDLVEDDLVEDEVLQEDHTEEKRDEPAEESDDEEFSALLSQPKKTDVDFEDLLDAEPDVIADEPADEPVDDVNDEPVDDEPVDDEPIDDEPVAEVEDAESVEASEPEESEKDAEDKPETEDTPESDEASPAADAAAPDSDHDESEGGQGESDVETPAEEPEPEPEPEPEVGSEPDEPAMEEENTPEEKEEPVQLPDTAFSSNPFGAKPKANTFKSDDIFSPKKTSTSTPKAATTFTTDDIFGGSSSSTKSKKVDDFDDMFGFSSPEQTKKVATPKKETSPSQPPDLFGMDITKGKGSAGLFTPKKQGGLSDIFGSGSKPAATKSAAKSTDKKSTGLDDIFSF